MPEKKQTARDRLKSSLTAHAESGHSYSDRRLQAEEVMKDLDAYVAEKITEIAGFMMNRHNDDYHRENEDPYDR